MSHYTATITKHSKDQPIGIGLAKDPNYGLVISSIASEGALSESCLKKGIRLLTINSTEVSGLSSKEALQILKDAEAEGKLVLSAEEVVPANITFLADSHGCRPDGTIIHGLMKHDINNAMPTIFKEADVPFETFCRIYKLIESDLIPPAATLKRYEITYGREMQSYVATQMVTGGMIGFGTESSHEKKFFQMVTKGSQLERNVDLKAMQVTMQVKSMKYLTSSGFSFRKLSKTLFVTQ